MRDASSHYDDRERHSGIWLECDPRSGYVLEVRIHSFSDQEQIVLEGKLAQILRPSAWGWIRRLIGGKNGRRWVQ